jgi:hypothetical protein
MPIVYGPHHYIDEDHHELSAFYPLNSLGTHVIAAVMHNSIEKQQGVQGDIIYFLLCSAASLL